VKKINNWNFYFFYFTDAKHLKKFSYLKRIISWTAKPVLPNQKPLWGNNFKKALVIFKTVFFLIRTNDPAPFNIRLALRRGHYSFLNAETNDVLKKNKLKAFLIAFGHKYFFLPKRLIIKEIFCLERQEQIPWTKSTWFSQILFITSC